MCHEIIGSFYSLKFYRLCESGKHKRCWHRTSAFPSTRPRSKHWSDLMAFTLWQRIFGIIEAILETLLDIMNIDMKELTEKILNDEKAVMKYAVMLDVLWKNDKASLREK